MSKGRTPPDQKSRDIIRGDLDHCVWVEAGAGSGKTTELVFRVKALVASGVPVGEISAITFTRKAAAELKTRCQIELEKAFQEAKPGPEKDRYETALRDFDSLFTETIHSFCGQLLRERPLEAGVSPAFEVIDESDDRHLQKLKLHERLDEVRNTEPATWDALQSAGIGPGQLDDAFNKLCIFAEVDFPAGASAKPDIKGVHAEIAKLHAGMKDRVEDNEYNRLEGGKALFKAFVSLDNIVRVRRFDRLSDYAAVMELFKKDFEDFKGNGKERSAKGWHSIPDGEEAQRLANRFRSSYAVPFLSQWRTYLYGLVLEVLLPARDAVLAARIKAGTLNENDFLRLAAKLLRENLDARHYFRKRCRYLLVDEFQDTDPIQAEILLLLTGQSDDADWTNQKPRPGSLFIVGDPKQSIYRFRRADIAVYKQVKEILLKAGAKLAPLEASFRSQPAICKWVNKAFHGAILPDAESDHQAAFAELKPMRSCPKDYEPGVRKMLIPAMVPQRDIPQVEAMYMASFIRNAVDTGMKLDDGRWDAPDLRGARYKDFLIISRGKADLTEYAAAMDRMGVPCEVIGMDAGKSWESLRVIIGLLKCLADPDDETALVAALRGPMFGISDDELFKHKQKGFGFRYLARLPEDAKGPVADACRLLGECYKLSRTFPAGAAIEAILERTGFLAAVRAKEGGNAQVSNLFSVIQKVREGALNGQTLADAVEALVHELEDAKGENMSRVPLLAEEDKVRIMNLHKAKGLEGRVVFLVEPAHGKPGGWPVDIHIRREGDKVQGFLAVQEDNGPYHKRIICAPADWEAIANNEKGFQDAEQDRLLYVAATRAKDILIISQYAGSIKGAGKPWDKLYPHLEDAPAVVISEKTRPPKQSAKELTQKDRKDEAKLRDASLKGSVEPSYSVQAVTELSHAGPMPKAAAKTKDEPSGPEWGSVIHQLLEGFVRQGETPGAKEIQARVKTVILPGTKFAPHVEDACRMVKTVVESGIWEAMLASKERHSEVPFQSLASGKKVVTGAIDLAYRVDGGWELVDYKTDRVEKDVTPWVEAYAPQLKLYRDYWERLTGEEVNSCVLFFIRTGQSVKL